MQDRFVWIVQQINNGSPQEAARAILEYIDQQVDAYERIANAAREFMLCDAQATELDTDASPIDRMRAFGYRERALAELAVRLAVIPEHS